MYNGAAMIVLLFRNFSERGLEYPSHVISRGIQANGLGTHQQKDWPANHLQEVSNQHQWMISPAKIYAWNRPWEVITLTNRSCGGYKQSFSCAGHQLLYAEFLAPRACHCFHSLSHFSLWYYTLLTKLWCYPKSISRCCSEPEIKTKKSRLPYSNGTAASTSSP